MKTTRKINGAKVTREWPDLNPDRTGIVIDKIKALIRGSKVTHTEQHKTISVKDSHSGHGLKTIGNMTGGSLLPPEKQKPSSLCAKLTALRKKKVKVVDFWRSGGEWQIKVMA